MPEKLSIDKALKKLGDDWETNNILDLVESGELPLYARCYSFEFESGKSGFKNERLWSSNNSENVENIEIIREAINTNSISFKLVIFEEQVEKTKRAFIELESHRPTVKDATTYIDGNPVLLSEIMPAEDISELFKQAHKKSHEKSLPSRFTTWGDLTVMKKENTIYSNPVFITDIYFLEKDILTLLPEISTNQTPSQRQSKILSPVWPKKMDTLAEFMRDTTLQHEKEYKETPSKNILWAILIDSSSNEYGVSYSKKYKSLEFDGKCTNKAAFDKRYRRIFPKTPNNTQ